MKVLGVTFTDTLSISPHVKYLVSKSAQISFALLTLRAHGLSGGTLWAVTQAHIISRLSYAAPAWWGFCNIGEQDQLQAIVSRLVKRNYLPLNQPLLHDIVATADLRLFNSIVSNPHHVLSPLIPPSKSYQYNLRKQPHNLQLPLTLNSMSDKNFLNRILLNLNAAWLSILLTYHSLYISLFCSCVSASVTTLIKRVYYYYYYNLSLSIL